MVRVEDDISFDFVILLWVARKNFDATMHGLSSVECKPYAYGDIYVL